MKNYLLKCFFTLFFFNNFKRQYLFYNIIILKICNVGSYKKLNRFGIN